MKKKKNEDLIPSGLRSGMSGSDTNTPIDIGSAKALHDEKVSEDSELIFSEDSNKTEKKFKKFDIDAVDTLEENKDPNQKERQ